MNLVESLTSGSLKSDRFTNAADLPNAVLDSFGNEITDPQNVCAEYRSEFKHRLRHRDATDEYKELSPYKINHATSG